jgi:hypothetical protein
MAILTQALTETAVSTAGSLSPVQSWRIEEQRHDRQAVHAVLPLEN